MMRLPAIVLTLIIGLMLSGCNAEAPPSPAPKPAATQPASDLIDINSADREQLMTLKGIGEARAKAIIKQRPYARKDELIHRNIIPQAIYDKIKDKIIARQK